MTIDCDREISPTFQNKEKCQLHSANDTETEYHFTVLGKGKSLVRHASEL